MSTRAENRLNMTRDELACLFEYDSQTGKVIWLVDRFTGKPPRKIVSAGEEAGSYSDSGYRVISINRQRIYTHRLAWMLVYGEWPEKVLDHIDTNRANNRLENLRLATQAENRSNTTVRAKSGFKGVIKQPLAKSYMAQITVGGEHHYLGSYPTAEEAHASYCEAARKAFGEFARFE